MMTIISVSSEMIKSIHFYALFTFIDIMFQHNMLSAKWFIRDYKFIKFFRNQNRVENPPYINPSISFESIMRKLFPSDS